MRIRYVLYQSKEVIKILLAANEKISSHNSKNNVCKINILHGDTWVEQYHCGLGDLTYLFLYDCLVTGFLI